MIDLVVIQDAIESNDQHHELYGNWSIVITQMKFDTSPCHFVDFFVRVVPSLNKTSHTWLLLTWKWRPRRGHWCPFLWPLSLLNNPLGWGMFHWFSLLKLIITTYSSIVFNSMHSTKKNIYSIMGCALVMVIIYGDPSRFWNIPLHDMKCVNY
jgi:hypothetical protein